MSKNATEEGVFASYLGGVVMKGAFWLGVIKMDGEKTVQE